MDVIFDAVAAEMLIEQMTQFCDNIAKEASDLLDTLELSGEWQDGQYTRFHESIVEIYGDLVNALKQENEYMQLYKDRVSELRG